MMASLSVLWLCLYIMCNVVKIYLLLSSAQLHLAILFHKVLHNLFGHSCGRRVHVVRRPLRQVTRTGKVLLTFTKVWYSGGSRVPGSRYLVTWVPGCLPSGDPFFKFRPALGTATELPYRLRCMCNA